MRATLFSLVAAIVGFADMIVLFAIDLINQRRVRLDTPPAVELWPAMLWGLYALTVLLIAIGLKGSKRSNIPSGALRFAKLILWLLIVRAILFGYMYWAAPTRRWRTLKSRSAMLEAKLACEAHIKRTGQPPNGLSSLAVAPSELRDAWHFPLGFAVDHQRRLCRITARGAPTGYRIDPVEIKY